MEILFDVRYLCERYKINHWVNHILVGFGRIPTHFLSYAKKQLTITINSNEASRACGTPFQRRWSVYLSFFFFSVESRQALSLSCCSILSSVDKFKNRVSANQYHMTISWAQDSGDDGGVPRQRVFCEKALN